MKISRVQIMNFRNFHLLDVQLGDHIVVTGENKVGKSNFIHALRLILDPSMPDSARQLREEDFWDGLPRPLTRNDEIVISIDLTDYDQNPNQFTVLADSVIGTEPMTSRLTYVFTPLPELDGDPQKEDDYEFFIYGGDRPENRLWGHEFRRRIPLDLLPALRDSEGDLSNWRRSPLRPLLDAAVSTLDRSKLSELAGLISEATARASEAQEIDDLAGRITNRLIEIVGGPHAMEMTLGFSPTDPDRLFRSLRLFIDGGRRGVSEASLGTANLLYLALKSLYLEQLVQRQERDHTFLAIEEPEAHLHPHIQRLVYRDFLRSRRHLAEDLETDHIRPSRTLILTTHSPHVVSVSPVDFLVVLRKDPEENSTEAVSTALLNLDERDKDDLERYLDVTRGEMLFAKAVLLVEGDAELFLLPKLAQLSGLDFDQLGITVCSVSGTNFSPYVKLLGEEGLNVPFAILTDSDPTAGTSDSVATPGQKRVARLLAEIQGGQASPESGYDDLVERAEENGIFLSDHTLEVDLFRSNRHKSMTSTLIQLTKTASVKKRALKWQASPEELDIERFLRDIEVIGKGRFAQRLATRIKGNACPRYIKKAFDYVRNLVG